VPARFEAYPPDRPALVRVLDENSSYRIGRSADCELHIDHESVSRHHADLNGHGSSWTLLDNASKNGVRAGGERLPRITFEKQTWFAIGDVYCSLEPIDEAAAATFREHNQTRRGVSHWLSVRLSPSLGIDTLITKALDTVLELAGLDRGFVLYAPPGAPLRVRASRGLLTSDIARPDFSGSVTAVERALSSLQSVVCSDTSESPWLGVRPSVRLGGIRAIACVPLRSAENALGALYADSRRPGPAITELDLELIETVAGQAAAALTARRLQGEVAQLLKTAADAGLNAPRWDELLARVPQ